LQSGFSRQLILKLVRVSGRSTDRSTSNKTRTYKFCYRPVHAMYTSESLLKFYAEILSLRLLTQKNV